jgi:hypothetical protein
LFEFPPKLFGTRNIRLLTLLASACQQNHERFSISTKVNPVARTEIDPQLLNAGSDALNGRNIATLETFEGSCYASLDLVGL